jgi:hypothetical protein
MRTRPAPRGPLAKLALCVVLVGACGSDDDRPARWSYIHPAIVVPSCATASCHSSMTKLRGLDLQDRVLARQIFIGSVSGLTILRRSQSFVRRMPPDQPLADADIDLIQRWFEAGAMDD